MSQIAVYFACSTEPVTTVTLPVHSSDRDRQRADLLQKLGQARVDEELAQRALSRYQLLHSHIRSTRLIAEAQEDLHEAQARSRWLLLAVLEFDADERARKLVESSGD